MEKTEYKIKMDQAETLVRQGDLKEALDVIDTLNYHKIRNVNVLLRASEIAEEAGEPEKGREILEIAHEKSPIARMIIYRLALISVKLGEIDEAETYYDEFTDIAPHDGLKYVIKYTIRKAQNADITELIAILEQLCDEDFTDKWAFELACLYRKHGDDDKCTALCDKVALWFGEGPYVEKSLEMKMMYKPLTPEQEEQYRRLTKGTSSVGSKKEKELSDTITIPQVEDKPGKFDTVNLQAEIRKNIQEIMKATEAGEVSENMDAIKDLVGDIPYVTEDKPDSETDQETSESTETAESEEPVQEESKTPIEDSYHQYLAEEYDGQMALNLPSGENDEQIEGQLTIDDVLDDWARQQRAMEAALNDARKKKLEEAKEKALREANQIMDRLVNISPQLEAGVAPEEILKEEYLKESEPEPVEPDKKIIGNADEKTVESAAQILAGVNDMLQHEIDTMSDDTPNQGAAEPEKDSEEIEDIEEAGAETSEEKPEPEETIEPEVSDEESETPEEVKEISEEDEETQEKESEDTEEEPETETLEEEPIEASEQETETKEERPEASEEEEETEVAEEEEESEAAEEEQESEEPEEEIEPFTGKRPEHFSPIDDKTRPFNIDISTLARQIESEALDEDRVKVEFTDEEKGVLSYFTDVHGMSVQIQKALNAVKVKCESNGSIKTGNLTISGSDGSGKTALASKLVQIVQMETGKLGAGAGKITGEKINSKDLNALIEKVKGGSLMIEKAGGMNYDTAVSLALMIENDRSGTLFILEDSESELKKLAEGVPKLWKYFTEHLSIPEMTQDELVNFGKIYVLDCGYSMDDMGILALYDRIGMLQGGDNPVSIKDVKEILDEGIARYKKRSKGFFSHFSARISDEDGRPLLQEKDIIA
ncbi:MAG: hypothetical protein DUD27_02910 [Lachnospiraceae bacterium]|uniref:Uncharacterized protein n=1 Tax=Candidatus Weimeria bifida TaxID=2599074 RepID=A0A6N7J0F4_9FIRM|nr:hypothetical protein [Candidatus Weimeria bifida]RRF96866.1 MAG: hypothetical protein DUD27_02910 [Lachnospiraceae bacterium]